MIYIETNNSKEFLDKCLDSTKKDETYKVLLPVAILCIVISSLRKRLKEKKLYHSYVNVELPVSIIFAKMELGGFILNIDLLRQYDGEWKHMIDYFEAKIKKRLMKCPKIPKKCADLNARAPKEVHNVFNLLGLYDKYKAKYNDQTPINQLKTNKEMLEKLMTIDELPR